MKRIILLLMVAASTHGISQPKSKVNIINYFASNNQIVGVPMVDMKNEFRFYPDLNFQNAISAVEVYYFVLNAVHKHQLYKREDGKYWSVLLKEFTLGESIQRVEVLVDCRIDELNKSLKQYGVTPQDHTIAPYLLLRRGDDAQLTTLGSFHSLIDRSNKTHDIINLKAREMQNSIKTIEIQTSNLATAIGDESKKLRELETKFNNTITKLDNIDEFLRDYVQETSNTNEDTILQKIDSARKYVSLYANDLMEVLNRDKESLKGVGNFISAYNTENKSFDTSLVAVKQELDNIKPLDLRQSESLIDKEFEVLKQSSANPANRLYTAYVENRLASMLDMRFKESDPNIIQFNYRNDKLSLQYLQADDPQEKLGIFRARLVPFAFYHSEVIGDNGVPTEQFVWQRGKVIYEIGINFGYAIVKGDNFTPKFFDMNRLGVGLGITSDTFSDDPTFLSVSLTYDVNTYTSVSFGANLIDKPGFYMGVGINARAFKDLVKSSAALFKGSN